MKIKTDSLLFSCKELDEARLALFNTITGCSCFLCNCNDWKKIVLKKDEFKVTNRGRFLVSKRIFKREQKRLLNK